MNWVREMAASVESDANHSVRVREEARSGLEVLAQAFGISLAEAKLLKKLLKANIERDVVRLSREADVGVEFAPSDCAGQETDFDEELAERLLSESMDRLAIVAKDMSDLAAESAIDLALIEAKRGQIDRAQAENWALLRELTDQAQ